MKKFIFAALVLICSTAAAYGQSFCGAFTGAATVTLDTITTSSSTGTLAKTCLIKGNQETVAAQVDVIKISGTISGYIQYMVSVDGGLNYYVAATDTLSNASAVYYHEYTQRPQYYKVLVTMSSSTQSSSYKVYRCNRPKLE